MTANKHQLFCFTFAGGTASLFDQIEQDLTGTTEAAEMAENIEVIKLEYAGHGARHREPLYPDFGALADDMFAQLKERYNGGSYALFGYSMGTITLVEVLRRILVSALAAPTCVFLAAHEPHTKSELLSFTPDEMDEWVKERTLKFGTVPEKLVNNKTFWRMYLPLYRHDYTLLAHYRFPNLLDDSDGSNGLDSLNDADNLPLKTSIPATIFYSETDTSLVDMKLWEKYFRGEVEYCRYEGQHFFIQQHHEEMARIIRSKMLKATTDVAEAAEKTAR